MKQSDIYEKMVRYYLKTATHPIKKFLWEKIEGKAIESSYVSARHFEESAMFQRTLFFSATTSSCLLPVLVRPMSSLGLFAYDGTQLQLLRRKDKDIQNLLRNENLNFSQVDPGLFAQFYLRVWLYQALGNLFLLKNQDTLGGRLEYFRDFFSGKLVIDAFQRANNAFEKPASRQLEDGSTEFTFMHYKPYGTYISVHRETVKVDKDFRIKQTKRETIEERVLIMRKTLIK
jgi:hypothetical protein